MERGFFYFLTRLRQHQFNLEIPSPSMSDTDLPPLKHNLAPGQYRHYKGQLYDVLGVAWHSESLEEMVVYRALYGQRGLWVRPAAMFVEEVEVGGQWVPRFQPIGVSQGDTE